jgi:DivIVA domain-containing protein
MDKDSFNLSSKDIRDKEFKIDTRGFRIKEVDAFLDEIIEDYEHYDKVIKDLEREKSELQDEILALKQEVRNLKTSIEIAKTDSDDNEKNVSNLDVLKRLSQLEKIVYGKRE